jgi:phage terminase small subunit
MGDSTKLGGIQIIQDPPEENLGPAMRALNAGQRRFVIALLETGASNNTVAAGLAGYGGTEGSRRVMAHNLAHNPKVQAAIKEEADRRLRAGALLAASALVEIAGNPMHKDRFKASVELLNRAGLIVQTEHKVIVEDNRLSEEIEQGIIALSQRLGVDPTKLLGNNSKAAQKANIKAQAIDAEFTEVDDLSDIMGSPNEQ